MILRVARRCRQARVAASEPAKDRPGPVVDSDREFREIDRGVAEGAFAGEEPREPETAGIVVLVGGAAAVPARRWVGAVRGDVGINVVNGVPEQAAVVRGLVAIRMVDVDVGNVPRQLAHRLPPAPVAALEELDREPFDRIVLVVVVRDERRRARMPDGLVIAVDVAEMPPAVLVDDLALRLERVGALDGGANQRQTVRCRAHRRWAPDSRLRRWMPHTRESTCTIVERRTHSRGDAEIVSAAKAKMERVGLLLAALDLVQIEILRREEMKLDGAPVRRQSPSGNSARSAPSRPTTVGVAITGNHDWRRAETLVISRRRW